MISRQPLIGYTALDSTESSAVMRFNFKHGIDAIAAHAGATALRSRIEALTGCVTTRQSVSYPFSYPDAAAPVVGALATRVGVFVFATVMPDEYAIVEIPGLLDSFLVTAGAGAGVLIDQAAPAVIALVAALTSALWVNRFGVQLVSLEAAFLQIRP